MPQKTKQDGTRMRSGIGEWYGKSFASLTNEERDDFSHVKTPTTQICIPRSYGEEKPPCVKAGGVCSLRLYQFDNRSGETSGIITRGSFATLCPHRFKEKNNIFHWVGNSLFETEQPIIITEVGFLIRDKPTENIQSTVAEPSESHSDKEDVGKIDDVLIHPDLKSKQWCALELQAAYFSGSKMSDEYTAIRENRGDGIPFPTRIRRPDYRSSGPKRLMPQLQIKVPTLRRWGKKLAIIVDKVFSMQWGKWMTLLTSLVATSFGLSWITMRVIKNFP